MSDSINSDRSGVPEDSGVPRDRAAGESGAGYDAGHADAAAGADADAGTDAGAVQPEAHQPDAVVPARSAATPRELADDHSVTLDDGTVVRWESWRLGEEVRDGKEVRVPVTAEGEQVAEYVRVGPEEAIATVQGAWDLDVVGMAVWWRRCRMAACSAGGKIGQSCRGQSRLAWISAATGTWSAQRGSQSTSSVGRGEARPVTVRTVASVGGISSSPEGRRCRMRSCSSWVARRVLEFGWSVRRGC